MTKHYVQYIELQLGVPLRQPWPWRAVVLAIAAVVLILFLWSMPAWAGA